MRRLQPAKVVSVNLPTTLQTAPGRHTDVIDFRVIAVIDTVVALEPLEQIRNHQLPNRIRDCYLTFGEGHGLTGLKGHLYQRKLGDWRFKTTDPAALPDDSDHRIRMCAPITIAHPNGHPTPQTLETETINIGLYGALVDAPNNHPAPQHANLTLSLIGEDEPIETHARLIAHQGTLWDYKFQTMNPDHRNRLGSFIIDYQRDLLKLRKARYQAEIGSFDDDLDL